MPSRNEEWRSHMFAWRGRRYFWSIYGAHSDALTTDHVVHRLPVDAINAPKERFGFDHLPFGMGTYDVMRQTVNLRTIRGGSLYTYMTGPGQPVDLALRANTIWLLYSDMGGSALSEGDFTLINAWVQVEYNERPHNLGSDVIDFDLVHIGKVVFETITMQDFGSYLASFVPRVGGSATPALEYTVRDRTFEFFFQDSHGKVYGWMKRRQDGQEEAVLLRYLDVFTKVQELASRVFRKIARNASSDVRLRSTYDGDSYSIGTPYDFTTHHARDLTASDARGHVLTRFDKQWLCFTKEQPGTDAPAIAGLLYPGDGTRQPSGLCALFPNVHDTLKAMTEEGGCKATYIMQGFANTVPRLTLKWFTVWDTDSVAPASTMPPRSYYEEDPKAVSGKNVVNGADAEVQQPKGENERSISVRNLSISANIRPYGIRGILTTAPCFDTPSKGADNFYWVRVPSWQVPTSQIVTSADSDFAGSPETGLIIGQSGFTFNRWFYLQDSDTTGGGTGPSWIDAAEPIVTVVHRETVIDFGDVSGNYGTTASVPFPTFYSPTAFGDGGKNLSAGDYLRFINDYLVPTMRQQQRLCNLYTLAYGIRGIFSDGTQTIMSTKVYGPTPFTDRHRATLFELSPALIRPDTYAHLDPWCALITYECDFSSPDISIETFHKATYI